MKSSWLGYVSVLIAAVGFGSSSIFMKLAFRESLTPWQLLSLQSLMSSGVLVAISLFLRNARRLSLREIVGILPTGLGSLGTAIGFTLSLQYLDASLAAMLLFTFPAFVVLGSVIFFKERISLVQWLSLGLTLFGSALATGAITSGGMQVSLVGLALGLLAAISAAFFNLFGQKLLMDKHPLTITTYSQLWSTVLLLFFIRPTFLLKGGLSQLALLMAAGAAIVASVIPFFLLLKGISLIGASRASIVGTFELPVTIALANLILREAVTPVRAAGAIIIVLAIILLEAKGGQTAAEAA